MARKQKGRDEKSNPQDRDNKPTAGDVKEKGFEDTTWEQHTDHDAASTEAERKNTAKTLPGSSAKDRK
ncbi:MAG TPA: hypothetical protein VD993_07185 [Chitinophagaceae bacterium]|nr:hypothetical protein [Chitinophagaceae bacterium]